MTRWLVRGIFGLGIVLGGVGLLTGAELRTWTDQTGKHATRATLVRVEGTKVILEREDGSQIQVERDKLSRTDQQYLAEQGGSTQNPFQVEEDPLAGPASSTPHVNLDNPLYPQGQLANIDWATVPEVPRKPTGEWKFDVPEPPAAEAAPTAKPLLIPPKRDWEDKFMGLAASPSSSRVLLSYVCRKAKSGSETRLVLCFLGEERVAQATGPGLMAPLALSDNGELALMVAVDPEAPWENRLDRLELWALTPNGVVPRAQWYPYDQSEGPSRPRFGHDKERQGQAVLWGAFLEDEQVATLGATGILAVWKTNPLQPLYYVKADEKGTPALSPDHRYLVFSSEKMIHVLDLKTRHVVASQESPPPLPDRPEDAAANRPNPAAVSPLFRQDQVRCVFSPQGQRLALVGSGQLAILNFATGELACQMKTGHRNDPALWTDESHVLLTSAHANNWVLYNVPTQTRLWQYDGINQAVVCQGVCWCLLPGWGQRAEILCPARLPHPGMKTMLEKLAGYPKLFPLRPGGIVRLDLDAIPQADEREETRNALTRRLQANGAKVAAKGDIDLVVRLEQMPAQSRLILPPGEKQPRRYDFRPSKVSLLFLFEGEPLWGMFRHAVLQQQFRQQSPFPPFPPFPPIPQIPFGMGPGARPQRQEPPPPAEELAIQLPLEAGQTVEQFLQKLGEPKFDWIKGVELPRYLSRFGSNDREGTIGRSQVTVNGIQDAPLVPTEDGKGLRPTGPGPQPGGAPTAPPDNKPRWK